METAGVIRLDLSLSLKPFYVTKTVTDLLEDLRKIDNVRAKLSLLNESLQKHKEELAPIEGRVFKGEFPHSVLLLKECESNIFCSRKWLIFYMGFLFLFWLDD